MAPEEFGRRHLPFSEKQWHEAEIAEVWFGVEACPEQRDSGAGSECLDSDVGLPPRRHSDRMLENSTDVHVRRAQSVAHHIDQDDIGHPELDRRFEATIRDQPTIDQSRPADLHGRP
jgi:hypothetical protein